MRAEVEEKSKILEQLTGTEIYSEISKNVHERWRRENELYESLNRDSGAITLLSDERRQELERQKEHDAGRRKTLQKELQKYRDWLSWLAGLEVLEKEIIELENEQEELGREWAMFLPQQKRLQQALVAAEFEVQWSRLEMLRRQLADDQSLRERTQQALPRLMAGMETSRQEMQQATERNALVRQQQRAAEPGLAEVRVLAMRLVEKEKEFGLLQEQLTKAEKVVQETGRTLGQHREELSSKERRLRQLAIYLKDHQEDAALVEGYEAITGELEEIRRLNASLAERRKKLAQLGKQESAAKKSWGELERQQRGLQDRVSSLDKRRKKLQHELSEILASRELEGLRRERDGLLREVGLLRRVESLENERNRLTQGSPCPLCGSREHPYVDGALPERDEKEKELSSLEARIATADKWQEELVKLHTEETEILRDHGELGARLARSEEQMESLGQLLFEERGAHGAEDGALNDKRLSLVNSLEKMGLKGFSPAPDLLAQELKDRKNLWLKRVEEEGQTKQELLQCKAGIERLEKQLQESCSLLNEKRKRQKEIVEEIAKARQRTTEILGKQSLAELQNQLDNALQQAEKNVTKARATEERHRKELTMVESRIASLEKACREKEQEIATQQTVLHDQLKKAGIADEKVLVANMLRSEERSELAGRAKALEERRTAIAARRKDRARRLDEERQRRLTAKTGVELQQQAAEVEEQLAEAHKLVAATSHRLVEDRRARLELDKRQENLLQQRKELERWQRLHLLIGSADGKKYRNFAQGLTFERMVSHANRELARISDRYLLRHDPATPLELSVVDLYQGGEMRSTRNLSGGESFIVSLSLALGLSKMASRQVRVDSLFLDEGFGTLDEETLETALHSLAGLRQEGKLIGVISHVPAIRERIPAQILITPQAGGRSLLWGPGVSRL